MTNDQKTLLKAAMLATAAILFLIGGFLGFGSYDTTTAMWGVAFTLVTVTFLMDHLGAVMGSMKKP
jgi:hypothetical protein